MNFNSTHRVWSVLAIFGALALLGFAVALTHGRLRRELQIQMARREAEVVASMLKQQLLRNQEAADPLTAILEASIQPDLPGIVSAELWNEDGNWSIPLFGDPFLTKPPPEYLLQAQQGDTVALFHPSGPSAPPRLEVFAGWDNGTTNAVRGVIRFSLDATGLEIEYRSLEKRLQSRSFHVWFWAGAAMTGVLGFTFFRLSQAHQLLQRRTTQLTQANQELVLAAKTQAVGAVASHLVHGLKNPLAALQQFVSAKDNSDAVPDWSDAAETTRRMRGMIDDVVRVLRDEQGITDYELTVGELLTVLDRRHSKMPSQCRLVCASNNGSREIKMGNREANLTLLILDNLVSNAVDASPTGAKVFVSADSTDSTIEFRVRDEGVGLSESLQAQLFYATRSGKPGGTGLGLAISRQLTLHLGGELSLESTSDCGSTFRLQIPRVQR